MNNNMILRNYSSAPPLQTYPQYFQQPIAQPLYTLAVAAPTNYGLAPYYQKPKETTPTRLRVYLCHTHSGAMEYTPFRWGSPPPIGAALQYSIVMLSK